jgi:hypothetical protein
MYTEEGFVVLKGSVGRKEKALFANAVERRIW